MKVNRGCHQIYDIDEDNEETSLDELEWNVLIAKLAILAILISLGMFAFNTWAQSSPVPWSPQPYPKYTIQSEQVVMQTGKTNYMTADIGTAGGATHCGGFVNYKEIERVPLQTTEPRCKIAANAYIKLGKNTWNACAYGPDPLTGTGSNCATTMEFTVVQGTGTVPTPLSPPNNARVQQ